MRCLLETLALLVVSLYFGMQVGRELRLMQTPPISMPIEIVPVMPAPIMYQERTEREA